MLILGVCLTGIFLWPTERYSIMTFYVCDSVRPSHLWAGLSVDPPFWVNPGFAVELLAHGVSCRKQRSVELLSPPLSDCGSFVRTEVERVFGRRNWRM